VNSKFFGIAAISTVAISLNANVNPAQAATFSFSYTFLSGESILGTVDGELQPNANTVGNLSNLSATYSAQPGTLLQFLLPSPFNQFFTLSGEPFFRFSGFASNPNTSTSQPNFGFTLGTPFVLNGATVGTFSTSSLSLGSPSGTNREEAEPFSASRWKVTELSTTDVPEPTTITGLALAGVGIATARRRQQRKKTA
jgi:hypothetical protein